MNSVDPRTSHAKKVLGHIEDMLGGEGWDNPDLLRVVIAWVDPAVPAIKDAENLVYNESFDPRDLVD